jgi:hypothetical protein
MQIANPAASFIRPANVTAYAAGQLVANSVTPGAVVPMAFNLGNSFPMGQFRLTRARLFKSTAAGVGTVATFSLHLYQALPTVTNGDGGAWLSNGSANWLGNIDIATMLAFSDGAAGTGSCPAGSEMIIRQASGKIVYGLLAALGAYVPGSAEQFTVTIEELDSY